MAAERNPSADRSPLSALLSLLTRGVLRQPKGVIVVACALAVVAIGISAFGLGFRHRRQDLLNPDSEYFQRWLAYQEEFGESDDVVVIVESDSQADVEGALSSLVELLTSEADLFESICYETEQPALRSKALHFVSTDKLRRLDRFLRQVDPVTKGNWSGVKLGRLLEPFGQQRSMPDVVTSLPELHRLMRTMSAALADNPTYASPWAPGVSLAEIHESQSISMTDSQALHAVLTLRFVQAGEGKLVSGDLHIQRLREIVNEVRRQHEGASIGMTGLPILEHDEMQTSRQDMYRASLLSLIAVAALFVAGLGGIRHPLMTIAALLLGMACAMGYVTLVIGHLNILSVSFGVILIGLGIDFGIHYVTRYLHLRGSGNDAREALQETSRSVGPGIFVGGVTTAVAFAAAALTPFTGVAELGLIAAGGLMICVLAMLIVLPALIALTDTARNAPQSVPQPIAVYAALRPLTKFPRLTVLAFVGCVVAAGFALPKLEFDHNLLHLQAEESESAAQVRDMIDQGDRGVWFAVSLAADVDELLERKQRFEQLESVKHVDEIVTTYLPPRDARHRAMVNSIAQRLASVPRQIPEISIAEPSVIDQGLAQVDEVLQRDSASRSVAQVQQEVRRVREQLNKLKPAEFYRRMSVLQRQMASDLLSQLKQLSESANLEPPRIDDLPPSIVDRFVGKSGKLLLQIHPQHDIWHRDQLAEFVEELESVDAQVTGHPVQAYYASHQMQRSYIEAAIYAFLAIVVILMLHLRSIRDTVLAMIPVIAGIALLFGIMSACDIPLNPANIIVLPLILGIGIDDGVHVLNDFRHQRGRYRVSNATAAAIVITSSTTIAGFGMMMFAKHRGLQSLGQVLTIGVFCCMVTSMLLLPALLSWITRRRAHLEEEHPRVLQLQSSESTEDATRAGEVGDVRRRAA